MASPVNVGKSIFNFWEESLVNEDIHIFYQYMVARFPDLKVQIDNFFIRGYEYSPCNMFVCDKNYLMNLLLGSFLYSLIWKN